MDDSLLAEFHSVFSVGGDVNATTRPHPAFSSLYKRRREGYGEQEARRRRLLEEQRERRRDRADYVRRIAEGEEWEEEMGDEEEDCDQIDSPSAQEGRGKKKRRIHPYRNKLMLSEWMVDVPPDLSENWHMTVCPVGRRSLVVASRGTTTAYSRTGLFLNSFPSLLPGGCHRNTHNSRDFCLLDCIFHAPSSTYFVLDLLSWGGQPVCDSDREFRAFWLRTKLEETPKISEKSRINPYIFTALESFSCAGDAREEGSMACVLSKRWPLEVDGLLFFHMKCHYVSERSPFAVWLKPHMVNDILHIQVSDEFLQCAPHMSDPLATPTSSTPMATNKQNKEDERTNSSQEEVKMN